MKQKILILLFGMSISQHSFAQLSFGIETGLSMGNNGSPYIGSFVNGGSVRYDMPFRNKLNLTCSIGYLSTSDKLRDGFPAGNIIIPVSGGVKYYFYELSSGLYSGFDLTLNILSYTYADQNFAAGFSPGIGYQTRRWDFTGRCNAISHASYFSFRVAYILKRK